MAAASHSRAFVEIQGVDNPDFNGAFGCVAKWGESEQLRSVYLFPLRIHEADPRQLKPSCVRFVPEQPGQDYLKHLNSVDYHITETVA